MENRGRTAFDLWRSAPYNRTVRTWALRAGDPIGLRVSADARRGGVQPFRDFVWQLDLLGGDPPALAWKTGYGQPGRELRLFPLFRSERATAMDPERFSTPPVVRLFHPSFVRVECEPLPQVAVTAEFWVPRSDTAALRLGLEYRGTEPTRLHLAFLTTLSASGTLRPFTGTTMEGARVLAAAVDDLAPVVFLTGGANFESGPYPGLAVDVELEPGVVRRWTLVHCAAEAAERSFLAARETAAIAWDAEIARLERLDGGLVDIETGEPRWDAVLAQSQTEALRAFIGRVRSLPAPAFVTSRRPDRGHSGRGDGRDFDPEWGAQDMWSSWSLAHLALAPEPELAKGVVRNLLSTQEGEGGVDAGPDLAGRRAGFACPPLLASLAWRIYQHTEDAAFLREVHPKLIDFANSWFDRAQDVDEDGWPEWRNVVQAGLRQVPAFVPWNPSGPAAGIHYAETVDLASYLYREVDSLLEMGQAIGETRSTIALAERRALLRRMVEEAWSEDEALYRHRDRDTHQAAAGALLGRRTGRGEMRPRGRIPGGSRVLVWCSGPEAAAGSLAAHLMGEGPEGTPREEHLPRDRFEWFWDWGTAVSQGTFSRLDRIVIEGVGREFRTEVRRVDLTRQDAGGLLPLWAGLADKARGEALVRRALLDEARFWREYGVPSCSAADPDYGPGRGRGGAGRMVSNAMIAEALAARGWRAEAAELIRRNMAAAIRSLTASGGFHELLDPDGGGGLGESGHVAGLFPVWAFLEVLGVRLLAPRKVRLEGTNPFPWPVEVCWRGLRVRREAEATRVTFPDGQEVVVPASGRQVVTQEEGAAEPRML